jgi:hypothetical protein
MDMSYSLTGGKRRILWDSGGQTPEVTPVTEPKTVHVQLKVKEGNIYEVPQVKPEVMPKPTTVVLGGAVIGPLPPSAPTVPPYVPKNGHKSKKVRSLHDEERDIIRNEFINLNGQTTADHWVQFKEQFIPQVVAIFQITGFVSYLHREVAKNSLILPNITAYKEWLKGQINLWAQYTSQKYQVYRNKKAALDQPVQTVQVNISGPPKLAVGFPGKMKYA